MTQDASNAFLITDVHVHLQDKRFGATWEDTELYIERAREKGVARFVCAATSPADWNRTAQIAQRFPNVLPTFGVHPWFYDKISGDWTQPLKMFLDAKFSNELQARAALGEVGLDFVVRNCDDEVKAAQEETLRAQLQIANERGIPVVMHSVRANERALLCMKEFSKVPTWLLHGWNATPQEIERACELGAFFSFSKRNASPRAKRGRETIAAVPRDRILLESDGPTPVPPDGYDSNDPNWQTKVVQARGQDGFLLDEPAHIIATAREIAAIKKLELDDFLRQVQINERRFFANWTRKD